MKKKVVKIKKKFEGTFNHQRQVFFEYCWAFSKDQAWLHFCRKIARKHGVDIHYVTNYFDGSRDNFEIKEIINVDKGKGTQTQDNNQDAVN